MKKLYLISQTVNRRYDTFDSAVVCAKDEEEARDTLPGGGSYSEELKRELLDPENYFNYYQYTWAQNKDDVKVEYLGQAVKGLPEGVVCSSFNAG